MSAADELVDVATNLVPGTANIRWALRIGAWILLLAIIAFALWWFLIRPAGLKQDLAQAKVETNLSGATATAATGAIAEVVTHQRDITTIHEITREGEHAVQAAAGADVHSPAVAAALGTALCGMRTYQSEPDCAALQTDHRSVGPALPDVGSFTPGR